MSGQREKAPYTDDERQALLYRLFDGLLDALIDYLQMVRDGNLKPRAQMLLIILMLLKHNGIKVEKSTRRGALGELRNLRAALTEQKEPEESAEFTQPFTYGRHKKH